MSEEEMKDAAAKDVPEEIEYLKEEVEGKDIFVMNDGKVAPFMNQLNFILSQVNYITLTDDLNKLFDVNEKIHIFEGKNKALDEKLVRNITSRLNTLKVLSIQMGDSEKFQKLLPKEVPFAPTESPAPKDEPSQADLPTPQATDDQTPARKDEPTITESSRVQPEPSKNPMMPEGLDVYKGEANVTQSKFVIQNKNRIFVIMRMGNFQTRTIKKEPAPIGPLYEKAEDMLSNDAVYIRINKVNYKVDGYEKQFTDAFNKFFKVQV